MRYIEHVSEIDHLHTFIHNELKKHGIKIPKKKTRTRNDSQEVSDKTSFSQVRKGIVMCVLFVGLL